MTAWTIFVGPSPGVSPATGLPIQFAGNTHAVTLLSHALSAIASRVGWYLYVQQGVGTAPVLLSDIESDMPPEFFRAIQLIIRERGVAIRELGDDLERCGIPPEQANAAIVGFVTTHPEPAERDRRAVTQYVDALILHVRRETRCPSRAMIETRRAGWTSAVMLGAWGLVGAVARIWR